MVVPDFLFRVKTLLPLDSHPELYSSSRDIDVVCVDLDGALGEVSKRFGRGCVEVSVTREPIGKRRAMYEAEVKARALDED